VAHAGASRRCHCAYWQEEQAPQTSQSIGAATQRTALPGQQPQRPDTREALRIAVQIDDRVAQFYLVGALGCQAATSGAHRLAAQLLGASENLRAETGASVNAILAPLLAQATGPATAALGQPKFGTEVEAGARYSRDTAVRLALGEPSHRPAGAARDSRTGPLAKRDAQVARLVADGLTSKQIGSRLFISERTAENHIRNIMNKLGFRTRAQIASWIAGISQ
jgi:DNA-binding CsgD family transcriptional regulator